MGLVAPCVSWGVHRQFPHTVMVKSSLLKESPHFFLSLLPSVASGCKHVLLGELPRLGLGLSSWFLRQHGWGVKCPRVFSLTLAGSYFSRNLSLLLTVPANPHR